MTTVNKLNICLKNLLIETIPKSLQNLNISYILKMSNFKLQLSFGHKTVGAPKKYTFRVLGKRNKLLKTSNFKLRQSR